MNIFIFARIYRYTEVRRKLCIRVLVALVLAVVSLAGCGKYEDVKITSGKIVKISMNGFRTVDILVNLGVDNPAGKIEVKSAEGTLKHFGKVLGKVTTAPVVVMPRTSGSYDVMLKAELAQGLGFQDIMLFSNVERLNECMLDLEITGKVGGVAMKKKYKDIPLKKLLEGR